MEEENLNERVGVDVEQIADIQKGKVVHGLTCEEKDFSEGREFNREPLKTTAGRMWCDWYMKVMWAAKCWTCCSLWMDLSGQPKKATVVIVVKVGRDECEELRFICIAVEFHVVWLKQFWKV